MISRWPFVVGRWLTLIIAALKRARYGKMKRHGQEEEAQAQAISGGGSGQGAGSGTDWRTAALAGCPGRQRAEDGEAQTHAGEVAGRPLIEPPGRLVENHANCATVVDGQPALICVDGIAGARSPSPER